MSLHPKTPSLLRNRIGAEINSNELQIGYCFIEIDLVVEENFVFLVKLLFNGATYKNLNNSKEYIWTALK